MEQIQALLEKEPNDVFLNFSLGMELKSAGRPAEALAAFDRVLEIDGAYHAAYFRKAAIHQELDDIASARAALEAGAEVAGRSGDAHAQAEMLEMLASLS